MKFHPPQRQRRWAFRSPAGAALILAAAVLPLSFSSPAAAQGNVSKAEADAKLRYCEVCHGVSAQGFHGYYPIPRLAGQPTEYLKNQLHASVGRSKRKHRRRKEDLRGRRAAGKCSRLRFVPWACGQGQRTVSASSRPALRLRDEQVDELGEGARTKPSPAGHLGGYAADRA